MYKALNKIAKQLKNKKGFSFHSSILPKTAQTQMSMSTKATNSNLFKLSSFNFTERTDHKFEKIAETDKSSPNVI